jgi:hypothetical protein
MHIPDAARTLERDLRTIFGERLQSLVSFASAEGPLAKLAPTLAVVDHLTVEDLTACAARVDDWHDAGLATPLLLEAGEFARSLDAFPFEFGSILAEHVVLAGSNPFDGLSVDRDDLRRACEQQARSHLLHLREGYLETRGRADLIADLITRSAPPLAALVKNVARLNGGDVHAANFEAAARHVEATAGLPEGALTRVARAASAPPVSPAAARAIFPAYLDAMDKLSEAIDRWSAR